MTLAEQLAELEMIKELILQGFKNNVSAGTILKYTSNNTTVTYEGGTSLKAMLSETNNQIQTIKSNQSHLARIAS